MKIRHPIRYNLDVENDSMIKRRDIFLIIFIILGGLTVVGYWLLTPKIVSILPADASINIYSDTPIQITFSTAIKPDGIEKYLKFEPNTTGIYQVIGDTLVFTPTIPWDQDTAVKVTVLPGIHSTMGLALVTGKSWSFTTRHPWLFYLLDDNNHTDLYSIDPAGLDTQKVLLTGDSVLDYVIGPNHTVYYSTPLENGSTVIRMTDLVNKSTEDIVTCISAICIQPQISPDANLLVYHRQERGSVATSVKPSLWVQKLSDGKPAGDPVPAGIMDHVTRDPKWSTSGWLAFYDETSSAFQFYYPPSGARVSFDNGTGEPGSWSADGSIYGAPDINYYTDPTGKTKYYSQIITYNPQTGERKELTRDNRMEDLVPTFSPDGKQIALACRFLNSENFTPGRQIWAMNVDGTNLRPLTNSAVDNHLGFAWSPTGDMLAYLQFNTASLNGIRELWLMNMITGTTQQILTEAYNLQWLP